GKKRPFKSNFQHLLCGGVGGAIYQSLPASQPLKGLNGDSRSAPIRMSSARPPGAVPDTALPPDLCFLRSRNFISRFKVFKSSRFFNPFGTACRSVSSYPAYRDGSRYDSATLITYVK